MSRTALIIGFFVAAVTAGLLLKFGLISVPREHFMQKPVGMPIHAQGMGPYDQSSTVPGWMANESEAMPVSTQPVGDAKDPNKLMLMVGNSTSPQCCPSAFTTDSGCVCLTKKDSDLMAHRGGNK
jgi:hypothetical protein